MKRTLLIVLVLACATMTAGQTVNPGRVNVVTTPWSVNWLTHANDTAALTDLGFSAWMQSLLSVADANSLRPQLLSGAINVKDFPYLAKGNATIGVEGGTDDTAAIAAALAAAAGGTLYIPAGVYRLENRLLLTTANTQIIGAGSSNLGTVLYFQDGNDTAGFEKTTNFGQLTLRGLCVVGPGATGNSFRGIYFHAAGVLSSALVLDDVGAQYCGSDGIYVIDSFNCSFRNVWARYCGGNGVVQGGDQSLSYTNSGVFNTQIKGASWWFMDGNPVLQGLNCATVGIGAKFGSTAADPLGVSYCHPTINGLNIEPLDGDEPNAVGLYFCAGSNFNRMSGVQIYLTNGKSADYGIYWANMDSPGDMTDEVKFLPIPTGTYRHYRYGGSAGTHGSIRYHGITDISSLCSPAIAAVMARGSAHNGFWTEGLPLSLQGLDNTGWARVKRVAVTSATSPYILDGTTACQYVEADATGGPVYITLDSAGVSMSPGAMYYIKKTDAANNPVTITTYGARTVDGENDPALYCQNQAVCIVNDGTNWQVLSRVGYPNVMIGTLAHDYAGGASAWTLTYTEGMTKLQYTATNANGPVDMVFPFAMPSKLFSVYNGTSQTLTVKVAGQSGATVTNGKWASFTMSGTNAVKLSEQP